MWVVGSEMVVVLVGKMGMSVNCEFVCIGSDVYLLSSCFGIAVVCGV